MTQKKNNEFDELTLYFIMSRKMGILNENCKFKCLPTINKYLCSVNKLSTFNALKWVIETDSSNLSGLWIYKCRF